MGRYHVRQNKSAVEPPSPACWAPRPSGALWLETSRLPRKWPLRIPLGDHWLTILSQRGSSLNLKRKLRRSGQFGTVPDNHRLWISAVGWYSGTLNQRLDSGGKWGSRISAQNRTKVVSCAHSHPRRCTSSTRLVALQSTWRGTRGYLLPTYLGRWLSLGATCDVYTPDASHQ